MMAKKSLFSTLTAVAVGTFLSGNLSAAPAHADEHQQEHVTQEGDHKCSGDKKCSGQTEGGEKKGHSEAEDRKETAE